MVDSADSFDFVVSAPLRLHLQLGSDDVDVMTVVELKAALAAAGLPPHGTQSIDATAQRVAWLACV